MTTDDSSADSCGSKAAEPSASPSIPNRNSRSYQYRYKLDVYSEVLKRLKDLGVPGSDSADFDDDLWAHFNRLPARYVMDVNVERAEDVLSHKRLLELAKNPANRPAIAVRLVQVHPLYDENPDDSVGSSSSYINKASVHPPPAFGSCSNLESLAIEAANQHSQDGDSTEKASQNLSRPMHEITCSTDDKPKLLSQLTSLLAEMGLNIQEALAFSTNDGYSLDVFVVDGWPHEETEQLREVLLQELLKVESQEMARQITWSPKMEIVEPSSVAIPDRVRIPADNTDVWEVDFRLLKLETKVTSGSFGDLYRGTYCGQEVAVKIIKPERVDANMQHEFTQEVYIMRKIRHRNVVQFIGACTKPPTLCIVTEFMSGGSVFDFLHNRRGVFKLPSLLRAAIDISKGMNYLHQNNIIHRDLKAANLLMDENEIFILDLHKMVPTCAVNQPCGSDIQNPCFPIG